VSASSLTGSRTPRRNPQDQVRAACRSDADGGVDPELLDEVHWWRTDDPSYWSLEALATYVRAADCTGQSVESICQWITNEYEITLIVDDAP